MLSSFENTTKVDNSSNRLGRIYLYFLKCIIKLNANQAFTVYLFFFGSFPGG